MNIFRSIVFSAVLAGLCAGIVVSVLDIFGTTPLILAAEKYEQAGASDGHAHGDGAAQDTATAAGGHDHGDEEGWAPADGLERTLYTSGANILTAIGYAFILTGLFSLRGKPAGWHDGLLFGLAGFVSVMLAPALGLPPELPGTPAGDLTARQTWWAATVISTAAGLGLLAFVKKPWAGALAILLLVAPHLVGAPQPSEGEHALAPEMLSRRFVVVATVTSLIFCAALGTFSAYFHARFSKADSL